MTSIERSITDSVAEGQPPLYDNVEEWVQDYLLPTFPRPYGEVGSQRWHWCAQWWRHNEAVTTLTALWYAWEHARLEATGMINWLRDLHFHLPILCSADGPFRQCSISTGDRGARHYPEEIGAVIPAPPEWWNWWAEI